jgi:MoxR-like ATPase
MLAIPCSHSSQSLALIDGLDFVTPDLIQELSGPIIAHRLVLDSDSEYSGSDAEQVVQNILSDIPVPV